MISLRASLVRLLATAALFSFTVVAGVILAVRLPEIEARTREQAQVLSHDAGESIDGRMQAIENQLQAIARALDREPGAIRDRALLDGLMAMDGAYASVVLRDPQGRRLAQSPDSVALPVVLTHPAPPVKDVVWRDDSVAPGHEPAMLSVEVPLGRGLLVASISRDRLLRGAPWRAQAGEARLMLIDGQGHRLSDAPAPLGLRRNFAALRHMLPAHPTGSSSLATRLDDEDYLVGVSPLARMGWEALAFMPTGTHQYSYRSTVVSVLLGFLGAVFLSLLLAPVWARRLSHPFRVLADQAHRVAAGQAPQVAEDVGPVVEFQQLARDLDRMVAALRAHEAEVVRSERRLKSSLEFTPLVAVQWYDVEGRILYWNSASTALYGYGRDVAVGTCIADNPLIFADHAQARAYVDVLHDVAQSGRPYGPAEFELRHRDGRPVTVLATTFAIEAGDDSPILVCMDVDITARRRVEAELRDLNARLEDRVGERTEALREANGNLAQTLRDLQQAQQSLVESAKLAALGNLVAGVAHELNTPIGNGLMAVSTLDERLREFRAIGRDGLRYSDLQKFVDAVDGACAISLRNLQRAATLLASFKQVAVDQASAQRRRFDLLEVVDEVLLTLQPTLRKNQVRVDVQVAPGLLLDSYPGACGQVLTNLVANATLHAFDPGQGGVVSIEARPDAPDHVLLTVRDDGRGIEAGMEQRIFEPFYTTRMGRGGSGLGLHIVFNLVTRVLGGQVAVRHVDPHGLAIDMRIPLVAPQERVDPVPPTAGVRAVS